MNIPKSLALFVIALPWIAIVCATGYLAVKRYPPSGLFVAATDFSAPSPWIQPFLPSERVSSPGVQPDGWTGQRITDDPVYFTSKVPGPYDQVKVTLEYRPLRQTLMEFGLVRDAAGNDLDLQPMYSSELATSTFHAASYDGQTGFVKNGYPDSRLVDPSPAGLAMWDATSSWIAPADPANATTTFDVSLRGSHDFYLVPANGQVHLSFLFQAANRTAGGDAVSFRVYRDDTELTLDADRLSGSRDARMGTTETHSIDLDDAPPGVYRVSVAATDDVFIRKITTTSRHWVVGPTVDAGDVAGYATTTPSVSLYTDSRHVVVQTLHNEGEQTVTLGPASVKIQQTHTAYRLDRSNAVPLVALNAPRGDVQIVGDGFFAFSTSTFFEPKPRRLTDGTDLDTEGIQAVLTPYAPPQSLSDGWLRSAFTYDIPQTADNLRFVVSAPGIASRAGAVDVRNISLTYERPPFSLSTWLTTLELELKAAWHRL